MPANSLLKSGFKGGNIPNTLASLAIFSSCVASIFFSLSKVSSYLSATIQIETDSTFRRLSALSSRNPFLKKVGELGTSLTGNISNLSGKGDGMKENGEDGEGSGGRGGERKTSITTDKILSLLGVSSFSPIANIASAFSGLSSSEGNFIVGEGLTWSVKSGEQARSALSLGSGDTPTFSGLKIDSDYVLRTNSSGSLELLSIDTLDSVTETTIEDSIDTLPNLLSLGANISSLGGAGSTTRATLESALESDLDTLEGLTSIGGTGSTTRNTLESAMEEDLDIQGDVTGTGLTSVTVGKIHGITFGTPTATSGNILVADGDSWESVGMTGDATITSGGAISVTSVQANSVTLGTDTTGNYVAGIADAGNSTITVAGSGTETASVTLDIASDSLNFSHLSDSLVLDNTTTIDMDTNSADLNFDNGTLFIDSSAGNVGIGTTGPGAKLEVDTGGTGTIGVIVKRVASQTANVQEWQQENGTVMTSIDEYGNFTIRNVSGGGYLQVGIDSTINNAEAAINAVNANRRGLAVNVPTAGQDIQQWLVNSSVKAVIDNDGNMGIGYADPGTGKLSISGNVGIGTTSPDQALDVIGTIQSSNLLGGAINLTTDVDGNIIRDPSDERLKKDIVSIDGEEALEKILSLRGVRFHWKEEAHMGDQLELGLIAQEVEQILPEAVSQGGEYKSVKYTNLVGVIIEAIQRLDEKIEELSARVGEGVASLGFLQLSPQEPSDCNWETRGKIYFNDELNHFYGCNGTGWVELDAPQSSPSASL